MRNASDRRSSSNIQACAVCGASDARTLSTTRLVDGERIVVCASHKLAHHRSGTIAASVDELKRLTADRRAS